VHFAKGQSKKSSLEQKDTPSNPPEKEKKKGINVLLVGGCCD
jgi:hypothetical protein